MLPWLDHIPDPLVPALTGGFTAEFRRLSATTLDYQGKCPGPAALSDFEWQLEQAFLELITSCFGSATTLAEEYFGRYGRLTPGSGHSQLRFVLDPLDGSRSFLRGSSLFATSLAILLDGRPALGLVYYPAGDCLFSAVPGHGAWQGSEPLRFTGADDRIVVAKTQHLHKPEMGAPVRRLQEHGYAVERMECTSLKLCWLAQGRRAALVKWLTERNGVVQDWGTLAGLMVCRESDLYPLRLDGSPWSGQVGGLMVCDARSRRDLGLPVAAGPPSGSGHLPA